MWDVSKCNAVICITLFLGKLIGGEPMTSQRAWKKGFPQLIKRWKWSLGKRLDTYYLLFKRKDASFLYSILTANLKRESAWEHNNVLPSIFQ